RREVVTEGRRIPFDYLMVATGAEHAYFGHDWSSYAPGLKMIDDATYLRRRILLAFERAESEPDAEERRRLLNFVVVGGCAAGVKASPAGEWRSSECDRAGRVKVQADLSVPGHPNIFVIGDAAAANNPDGKPLPGVAPVAKQQGWYVANLLMARAKGKTLPA